ncbi:hypothetical protein EDD37DRAFT_64865 [Exophiala viscosa]|uniref:uncharacterized protein n=1 Tax=Exophiala viscosa TaxID=2486360 RepID=UPI00218EE567|nr:hypothetical protein EDD37DRAFT_64865 [Exophiala viscosa]
MARRPPTLGSLPMEEINTLRRLSIEIPNPNIFSDEYAVNPFDAPSDHSPVDSIDSRPEQLNLSSDLRHRSPSINRSSIPERNNHTLRSADPHRAISLSSRSMADTQRTLSTSSRLSIPRSQSPYRGPTAPSQPYGMYSQVTRASSIASESTIRPVERPFLSHTAPEHPYSMYPQNTVPEEDLDQDTHVPLGFPVLGLHSGSNSTGDDAGDIVGTDGHVEQLPPYSRYADNVIAKGDMARLDAATTMQHSGSGSPVQPAVSPASDVELTTVGAGAPMEEVARKEGFVQKKLKRSCCGLPLWVWLVLVLVVCLAAVLGGVIGGVVGNQKGAQSAASATTTVWLDADPASTGPSTPSCPTGHWTIPLNNTDQVSSCVVGGAPQSVWDCMDFAKLGINIFDSGQNGSHPGPPLSVVFDDYSLSPQLFRYGPQPPDFNGSAFVLKPFNDKDDDQLGIALFFSVLFDKVNILPAYALTTPSAGSKRSLPAAELMKRDADWMGSYLSVGDQPWYCFWNSTISEFWIFLDENMDGTSTANATITSSTGMATNTASTSNPATSAAYTTSPPTPTPSSATQTGASPSTTTGATSSDGYWNGEKMKRSAASGNGSTSFPKLVKMLEKRKPGQNIQPYCQQMQVLNDWQIVPIPTVQTIAVEELESTQSASATATSGGSRLAIRKRDSTEGVGSNCLCEWFSI